MIDLTQRAYADERVEQTTVRLLVIDREVSKFRTVVGLRRILLSGTRMALMP